MTDDLMHLADTLGFQTPARRFPLTASAMAVVAAEETGGPVRTTRPALGEELTPSSAAAAPAVARESTGVAPGAGANVPGAEGLGCKGRVDGAVGAATFLSPRPPSLRFALGRVRAQGIRRLLDRNPLPPGAMEMGRRFPGDTAKFVGPKP